MQLSNKLLEWWDSKIVEFDAYFKTAKLPSVYVEGCETCTNLSLFIDNHLRVVKRNKNKTYLPYLERLHKLKIHIENEVQV